MDKVELRMNPSIRVMALVSLIGRDRLVFFGAEN
jgi:hypothetical protein